MVQPMRSALAHAGDEDGFTLVELLVVVVVIAILASIAISGLLSKRAAAGDSSAKQLANTAEHAAIIYNLNNGTYSAMTPAGLQSVEPSINVTANGQTVLAAAGSTATGYSVAAVSSAGDTFNITNANGVLTRTCSIAVGNGNTVTNTGGGCTNGIW